MQLSDGITDSPWSMAPMSCAEAGAAAPYLAQNLVWGLLARARGVAIGYDHRRRADLALSSRRLALSYLSNPPDHPPPHL